MFIPGCVFFSSSSCHHASYVHSLYLFPCHAYISVPKGVMVLELELPESEGQQGEPPQGAEEEEDLPECPDHRPSTYVEGKPRSIISLLLFLLSRSAIN